MRFSTTPRPAASGAASLACSGPGQRRTADRTAGRPLAARFFHFCNSATSGRIFSSTTWRDRADLLEADDAGLVDDVGLGHAVDAVVDADAALDVERSTARRGRRTASSQRSRVQAAVARILVVEAVDRHDVARFARSTSIGCSWRQETHHEAQTLSSQTLPCRSFGENVASGWCSCGSVKAGAGLPISGEGTSRGLRLRPMARNTTSTMKMPSGSRKRFMPLLSSLALAATGRRRAFSGGSAGR
jgi:hypothetical protein